MTTVREGDLDATQFHCCGDEDLFPYKCSACRLPLVFCYECDTLYPSLPNTALTCAEWHAAGLDGLLLDGNHSDAAAV